MAAPINLPLPVCLLALPAKPGGGRLSLIREGRAEVLSGRRHFDRDGGRMRPNFLVLRLTSFFPVVQCTRRWFERMRGRNGYSMARGPGGETEPAEKEETDANETSASANCLLDSILNSLYDFGESLPNGNKKKKSKNKHSPMTASNKLSEDKRVNLESGATVPGKRKSVSSFFDSLKDELAYDCINTNKSATECRSPSGAMLKSAQQENTTEIEVVTFHGQHGKKKAKLEIPEVGGSKEKATVQEKHGDGQAFNLEKARLEVHRFGITGFEKKEQRVLEQERAIMLGAKVWCCLLCREVTYQRTKGGQDLKRGGTTHDSGKAVTLNSLLRKNV